jgi:predicted nucleotidyltransferase
MSEIDIRPQDLDILRTVLKARLPHHARVFVFGSRANGKARRSSDLDLAIDADRALTPDERAALSEAFESSDLPYKVDIADMHSIDEGFRALVEKERAPLLLI